MIMARSSGCAKTVAFFLVSLVFCVNMFQPRLLKPGIPLLPSSGTLGPRSMQTWGMTLSSATTFFRLSNFQDGGLWLECEDGDQPCPLQGESHRKGRVVDFHQDRISFDAQVPHCVMPWHGGSRVVLVAFTVKNHDRITAQDVNDLQGLGSSSQLGRLQLVTVFGWVSVNGCLNLRVVVVPVLLALLLS